MYGRMAPEEQHNRARLEARIVRRRENHSHGSDPVARRHRRTGWALVCSGLLASSALGLAAAPAARASNIVYLKGANASNTVGNDIWVSSPDGSVQRQITTDGATNFYTGPSETDSGTIVAGGEFAGNAHWFYLFNLDGSSGGGPWTSLDMGSCDTGPIGAQVEPAGGLIAYWWIHESECPFGSIAATVGFANANNLTAGGVFPEFGGFYAPRWIPGATGAGMVQFGGGAIEVETSSGLQTWLTAAAPPYLTSFDVSRSGNRVLLAYTAEQYAKVGQAGIELLDNGGLPPASNPQKVCASEVWADSEPSSSPRWSPDGSQFTWSDSHGVWVSPAPVSDGTPEANCVIQPTLIAAGGSNPDWGAANIPSSPAPQPQPGSGSAGTGGSGTTGGSSSPGGGGNVATSVQIASLLTGEITPAGKTAKIAALLKSDVFSISFRALEAGTAVIGWYEVPSGAHLANRAKPKPVLVASGRQSFSAAGTATIKIKLTAAGRRLLKHARQLRLTAKGTFTPVGKAPIGTTKSFVLKR
jgi:hypothetical protein